jgi:ABC-2 type transport system permease protein
MFRNLKTLFFKEIYIFFNTPLFYVLFTVFTLLSGHFFSATVIELDLADLLYYFQNLAIVIIFILPLLSMKLFAEEKKNSTIELLLTSPVSIFEIVFAKFFSLVFIYFLMIISTFVNIYFFYKHTTPYLDFYVLFSEYLGFFFLGVSYIVIGVFTSTLSKSQIICGILNYGILIFLMMIHLVTKNSSETTIKIINYISPISHYNDFLLGVIDLSDITYYISVVVIFLFLSIRSIESLKWR